MFDFIEGKVVSVKPDRVIIQVGGLGFSVKVPIRVSHYINKDKDILLYT
jgi:Holliday junction DNA helicase RuvA